MEENSLEKIVFLTTLTNAANTDTLHYLHKIEIFKKPIIFFSII